MDVIKGGFDKCMTSVVDYVDIQIAEVRESFQRHAAARDAKEARTERIVKELGEELAKSDHSLRQELDAGASAVEVLEARLGQVEAKQHQQEQAPEQLPAEIDTGSAVLNAPESVEPVIALQPATILEQQLSNTRAEFEQLLAVINAEEGYQTYRALQVVAKYVKEISETQG